MKTIAEPPRRSVTPAGMERSAAARPNGNHAAADDGPELALLYDAELRAELAAYREEKGLTLADLGRELGYQDATQVSKFLGGKPEGNIPKFQEAARALLLKHRRAAEVEREVFLTNVVKSIGQSLNGLREEGHIGLITGPAGCGKTQALHYYARGREDTIHLVTASIRNRTPGGLEALVMEQLPGGAGRKVALANRWSFLVSHFRRSNHLLIVDNAQRLARTGLYWLFDLHDQAGIPIALVGNPGILGKIAPDDQNASRAQFYQEIALKNCAAAAHQLLTQLCPDLMSDELVKLATQVGENEGHLRSLRYQIGWTQRLLKTPEFAGIGPVEAFRAAHEMLVRNYHLIAQD